MSPFLGILFLIPWRSFWNRPGVYVCKFTRLYKTQHNLSRLSFLLFPWLFSSLFELSGSIAPLWNSRAKMQNGSFLCNFLGPNLPNCWIYRDTKFLSCLFFKNVFFYLFFGFANPLKCSMETLWKLVFAYKTISQWAVGCKIWKCTADLYSTFLPVPPATPRVS